METNQNNTKSTDIAKDVWDFPCEFPIKVMGENSAAFVAAMHEIVLQFAIDYDTNKTTSNVSRTGKYVSLTLNIQATSKAQLDNIYRAVTAHPLTKYTL